MPDLPAPGERRVAVRVTKDALRQVRGGHPWVFDRSIESVSHDGEPGDLAVVFDEKRRFAAIGLWDPTSPIRVRILHAGTPRAIDAAFWRTRLIEARAVRRPLIDDPDTDAYRMVHGENDRFPGFVLDRYAEVAVIKLYSTAWFPHLNDLVTVIDQEIGPRSLVLRLARNVASSTPAGLHDGMVVAGSPLEGPVEFRENGLRFEAHPTTGQKTGHFLDQRDNRALVRELAAGRSVLDVFSCTGGFSVHAAAGGARSVHSVDLAGEAIATARRNMHRNRDVPAVADCRHDATVGDAFEVMADLAREDRRFELVIVDPPSFASRRSHVAGALRAYRRLTSLALDLLVPHGILVQASCSARIGAETFFDTVTGAAAAQGADLRDLHRTGHPLDHPIGFPEGAYLKAIFARLG